MKKILTKMAVAIVALTFSACSEEDNPSNDPLNGNAVITVNTQALYNELNAIDDITKGLTLDSCFIESSVLIYDANGNLVKQLSGETHQLEPMTFEAGDIPNGTYTLLAIQRLNFHGYELWKIVDIDQLATVRIDYGSASYPVPQNALGITSETVVVAGKAIEVTLTPKAAGSILDFRADGLRKSDNIAMFRMYAKPKTTGLYLNPALSDSERSYCNNDSTYLNIFQASTEKAVSGLLHQRYFTLNSGNDNVFLLYRFDSEGKARNVTTYNPKLIPGRETLIYYDFNDWNLNWQFCDFAEEFDKWMKEKNEAQLILDPCMEWGCSLDDVLHHMSTYKGWYSNQTKGELRLYNNKYWEEIFQIGVNHYVYYGFETQEGQNLESVRYIIRVENLPFELLTNSMVSQGYVYQRMVENEGSVGYYYQTADKKTNIFVDDNKKTGYWIVWFYPAQEAAAAPVN